VPTTHHRLDPTESEHGDEKNLGSRNAADLLTARGVGIVCFSCETRPGRGLCRSNPSTGDSSGFVGASFPHLADRRAPFANESAALHKPIDTPPLHCRRRGVGTVTGAARVQRDRSPTEPMVMLTSRSQLPDPEPCGPLRRDADRAARGSANQQASINTTRSARSPRNADQPALDRLFHYQPVKRGVTTTGDAAQLSVTGSYVMVT
jgi:hypothetical protein